MSLPTAQALAETLASLIQTPSINPDLVADAPGEQQIAEQIAARLRQTPGIEVEIQQAAPGRPNLIATAGSGTGKTLMLNGHLDTVDVEGMDDPFSGKIENGRVYGRGAFDMKASLAAMIHLLETVATDPNFPGKIVATFVADEEYASIGTSAICAEIERWSPDAAIVTEPTELEVSVAHKGFSWLTVTTHGIAAHGSDYGRGVDAITHMGRILHQVDLLSRDLPQRDPHQYTGAPSLHASLIEGGSGLSTYPARCQLRLERRTIPGEPTDAPEQELKAIIERLSAEDDQFKADLTVDLSRDAYEIDLDSPIVKVAMTVHKRITGDDPIVVGEAGWMDSALLGAVGVPTVIYGPSGDGAHAHEEWADIERLELYARSLTAIAYEFCGG